MEQTQIDLNEYVEYLNANDRFLPKSKAISRKIVTRESYRSWFFGVRRNRIVESDKKYPTWDLFDEHGEDVCFCFVLGQGIAAKLTHYETYGQIFYIDSGPEEDSLPIRIDTLYMLKPETIPDEEAIIINDSLARLISP